MLFVKGGTAQKQASYKDYKFVKVYPFLTAELFYPSLVHF